MSVQIKPTVDMIRRFVKEIRNMDSQAKQDLRYLRDTLQACEDHLLMAMQSHPLSQQAIQNSRMAHDLSKTAIAKWLPQLRKQESIFSIDKKELNRIKASVRNLLKNTKSIRDSHKNALNHYSSFVVQTGSFDDPSKTLQKLRDRQEDVEQAYFYAKEAWDWVKSL